MTTQPQLFGEALAPSDIVYTPDAVARDIIDFFEPSGRILDPCKGDGAFYRNLPAGAEYCEIDEGKDFFAWHEKVDWIIGNPPYSIFLDFLKHSFSLSENVVYLVPTNKIFQSWNLIREIEKYGGIRSILAYGSGHLIGLPFGFSVGAFHFQRNYGGGCTLKFKVPPPLTM